MLESSAPPSPLIDRWPSFIMIDADENGIDEVAAIDYDGNGILDTHVYDEDEDGEMDFVLVDRDENGTPDDIVKSGDSLPQVSTWEALNSSENAWFKNTDKTNLLWIKVDDKASEAIEVNIVYE